MKREASKYFIEQLIISEDNTPDKWTMNEFNLFTKKNACIGFLFSVKKGVKFGPDVKVLNLYLINPEYIVDANNDPIELSFIVAQWFKFLDNLSNNDVKHKMVFRNPPIKYWLDTKENWCKKQADYVTKKYGWRFDDALSEVYYTVMDLFQKGHVYMGNLGYISNSVANNVKMNHRYNKNRLNGSNPLVISGDQTYEEYCGKESNLCSLWDQIGKEDDHVIQDRYEQFEKDLRALMLQDFSNREIDQIFTQTAGYLPMNLYRRLLKWRKQHPINELRSLI